MYGLKSWRKFKSHNIGFRDKKFLWECPFDNLRLLKNNIFWSNPQHGRCFNDFRLIFLILDFKSDKNGFKICIQAVFYVLYKRVLTESVGFESSFEIKDFWNLFMFPYVFSAFLGCFINFWWRHPYPPYNTVCRTFSEPVYQS